MPNSILVIGLGELGEEVVKSLATHPKRGSTEIAVLLRSRKLEQLHRLEYWNVEAVSGDVVQDSLHDLARIFSNYETVICCTGMYAPPETQIKILKAVLAAGVKRYFPWQFGIDYDVIGRNSSQDLFDSQLDVRDILRSQIIDSLGDRLDGHVHLVPIRAAEIALAHPEAQGVLYTAGDTISMSGLANVVAKVTGKEVTRMLKTVTDLEAELDEDPLDGMRKYRVVFAEGRGVAWSKEMSFNGVVGVATKTVEEWARENLK